MNLTVVKEKWPGDLKQIEGGSSPTLIERLVLQVENLKRVDGRKKVTGTAHTWKSTPVGIRIDKKLEQDKSRASWLIHPSWNLPDTWHWRIASE